MHVALVKAPGCAEANIAFYFIIFDAIHVVIKCSLSREKGLVGITC